MWGPGMQGLLYFRVGGGLSLRLWALVRRLGLSFGV